MKAYQCSKCKHLNDLDERCDCQIGIDVSDCTMRDIHKLLDVIERLTYLLITPSTDYMISPIGDLPINSKGLRKAVDEIERLQKELEQAQKHSAQYMTIAEKRYEMFEEIVKEKEALFFDKVMLKKNIDILTKERDKAVEDLSKCKIYFTETCANYNKCYKKAFNEFRIMPCSSCKDWTWRGIGGTK